MPPEPQALLRWLDYIPVVPLAIAATVLVLSPPLAEPHLWQKLKLLAAGQLERSVDILDFFIHVTLLVILGLKLMRLRELGQLRR